MYTPAQIQSFLDSQLGAWPMAQSNFDALKTVRTKEIELPGWTLKVQFNPARAVSSGAKVDAASLAARKCFLCAANRPECQNVLPWMEGRYEILINPFPIFPRHLTIPDSSHTDQRIAGRLEHMMQLANELQGYTVFYNGPRCGASAPDHMHFQAGNSDFLTLWTALDGAELQPVATQGNASLSMCTSLPMNLFVLDADAADGADATALFEKLCSALPQADDEPMMNILAKADASGRVRVAVIPRKRHRPSFYGTEGPGTMLLSPASVDMGGVFITPLEKDFDALDADTVLKVFDELCLDTEQVNNIAALCR